MLSSLTDYRPRLGFGRLGRFILAARLLLQYLGKVAPKICPNRCYTSQGHPYDLYKPLQPVHGTLLMVYGFTMAGETELRLVRFAQVFASFGFRVVVPDLPGLKSLDLVAGDLELLISMITYLHCDTAGSIGLIGFSVGGGIALTAATNPDLSDNVDPVLLFGPHYSLPDLWTDVWQSEGRFPKTKDEWDNFIWRQLTLAYRQRRAIGFNAAEQAEIVDLLRTYCSKPSLKRKLEVYERLVRPHGLLTTRCEKVDLDVLEYLSPRGKLGTLKSKVLILHDCYDSLIPPSQSQYMLTELRNRSMPHIERLVITPLLSHVNPHAMLDFPDLLAILDLVGELFTVSSKL